MLIHHNKPAFLNSSQDFLSIIILLMCCAVHAPLAHLYRLIIVGTTKPHALTIAISSRLPMTINILTVIWCPLWHLTPPNPQFSNTPMFSVSSYISSLHHQKDDTFYILHTIAPFSSGTFLPKTFIKQTSAVVHCHQSSYLVLFHQFLNTHN